MPCLQIARRHSEQPLCQLVRYRELVLTTYCLPEVQINDRTANTSSEQAEEASAQALVAMHVM